MERSFSPHDHSDCIATSLAAAERLCTARGVHLTPVRRRVLEILLEGHAALGAYDVLARLKAEGMGSAPPTAYRALDFLLAQGLAHRIERVNGYVACVRPGAEHDPAFMICRDCGTVAEADLGMGRLQQRAAAAGFRVAETTVEAEGVCPTCQEAP